MSLSIAHGALVSADTEIEGDVSIGAGAIVQPGCKLLALAGCGARLMATVPLSTLTAPAVRL